MSIVARRMNVASSQTAEGGTPSVFSFCNTSSSMKFLGCGSGFDRHTQRNARAEHADLSLITGHDGHVAGEIESS